MSGWEVPLTEVGVDEADIEAVVATYRSGWLSMGPRTEEFEGAFAGYVGSRHALATANGTAALHLACLAAGLGPGDEAIVPSLSFVATANAVAYTGATPVFADIAGPDQPWLSATGAEKAISPRTRAIVTMPYGGHPGDTARLAKVARDRGLVLIEDAAHAAGAQLGGRHLGTFGAAGSFSFFPNKNLAVGEAGMLVTDDDGIAERARLLRSHGMTTLTWERHRTGAGGYDVVEIGFNYRIDEPRASFARSRLARLDQENARRREIDARYRELLRNVAGLTVTLERREGDDPAHHLFAVVLDHKRDRDAFRSYLADKGVQTSVHYPPIHLFSAYRSNTSLPFTETYAERTVTLPLFPGMSQHQLETVVGAVRDALA